ncbi:hypothetical protein [Thiolapillus brandeum]|uniref:High-affinity iron transporter component 1 n=1 Tax=Thiolapillus brandeum TaxID=1076588 RepID=A0A7U6GHI4_9GAMM|nr:hypothetical protein [Thiolapillus brandeum]BAO43756.1 high-affinity iron transporter component 1 [Thiolapillus brandeum]
MKTINRHPARCRRFQPGLLLILLLASFLVHAENSGYWQQVASRINASISEAEAQYAAGDARAARAAVVNAYFSQFEDSKMEAAMRMELGSKHTWQVEKSFGRLRKAIKKGAPKKEVTAIAEEIRTAIGSDAKKLDAAGISAQVFEVNQ